MYAVTDFKVKDVDVQLGAGYGFTPGSDRLIFTAIIGYAFPVPGKNNDTGGASSSMTMGTQPSRGAESLPGEIGLRVRWQRHYLDLALRLNARFAFFTSIIAIGADATPPIARGPGAYA